MQGINESGGNPYRESRFVRAGSGANFNLNPTRVDFLGWRVKIDYRSNYEV